MPTLPGLTQPVYLDLDLTGQAAANLVKSEVHQTHPTRTWPIRLAYGAFFADTLKVYYLGGSGELFTLKKGVDYTLAIHDRAGSAACGKDIYEALLVKPTELGVIYVDYQALGGTKKVNTPYLNTIKAEILAGASAVDYEELAAKPETLYPTQHEHDARYYLVGFDHINRELTSLLQAMALSTSTYQTTAQPTNLTTYKNYDIKVKVDGFKTAIASATTTALAAITAHVANTGYSHTYTAEMVGLGKVANFDFTTTARKYASPSTVKTAVNTLPPYVPSTHDSLTNNPHGETKSSVGLDDVVNYGMVTAYATGTSAYTGLLFSPSQTQYLAPYPAVTAVAEAQAAEISTKLTAPVAALTAPGGAVATLNALATNLSSNVRLANDGLLASTQYNQQTNRNIVNSQNANRSFYMKHYNEASAAAMVKILEFDYGSLANGYSVGVNGYWNLPPNIPNLHLWLDADFAGNSTVTDSAGTKRILTLVDRSEEARIFAARSNSQGPALVKSADVAEGQNGLLIGNVMRFDLGNYLDQISGSAVSIRPGMTIFAVIRTKTGVVNYPLMSSVGSSGSASIRVSDANKRAITVATDSWTALRAPINTATPNASMIMVATISSEDEAYNWLGSSVPINKAIFPRGTDTPSSAWPTEGYSSQPMPRIGDPSGQASGGLELADLLIYNRQLSFPECAAVIEYLRLVKTHRQALVVDLSAKDAFQDYLTPPNPDEGIVLSENAFIV